MRIRKDLVQDQKNQDQEINLMEAKKVAPRRNQAQPLNLVQIPSLVQNPALDLTATAHKLKKKRKRKKRKESQKNLKNNLSQKGIVFLLYNPFFKT